MALFPTVANREFLIAFSIFGVSTITIFFEGFFLDWMWEGISSFLSTEGGLKKKAAYKNSANVKSATRVNDDVIIK